MGDQLALDSDALGIGDSSERAFGFDAPIQWYEEIGVRAWPQ
jgi:hypothetical protein